jgi:hypothetical protein
MNTCDYPAPEEARKHTSEALISPRNFEEAIQIINTPTDMMPEEKVALL